MIESIYHFETDIECKVFHYGKEVCIVKPGEDVTILLRKGRHRLSFVSTENPVDQYSIMYEVPENGIEDCIEVKLYPYKNDRIHKEAEERRLAHDAEQKKMREEREKEERLMREKEEEERKKKEEEDSIKARAEAKERERAENRRLWEEREKRYKRYLLARDDYSKYVIKTIPNKDEMVEYLTHFQSSESGKMSFGKQLAPFSRKKNVGDRSEVFPVIKSTKRRVSINGNELVEFFANISFSTIRQLCHPVFRRLPFLSDEIQRSLYKEECVAIKDELLSISHANHYGASDFIQLLCNERCNNRPSILNYLYNHDDSLKRRDALKIKDQVYSGDKKTIIEYLLYNVANNNKWKDFFCELFDDEFFWGEKQYISRVLELIDVHNEYVLDCECHEYRFVYIDEACNEIIETDDSDAVSFVRNGIMVWANRHIPYLPYRDYNVIFSLRDYLGNELCTLDYNEPRYLKGLFFQLSNYGRFFEDGHICLFNPCREFWLSGIINELPDSGEERLTMLDSSFVFINPSERIVNLPDQVTCCLVDGRYYISTYQGLLQVEKPKEWDLRLAEYRTSIEKQRILREKIKPKEK